MNQPHNFFVANDLFDFLIKLGELDDEERTILSKIDLWTNMGAYSKIHLEMINQKLRDTMNYYVEVRDHNNVLLGKINRIYNSAMVYLPDGTYKFFQYTWQSDVDLVALTAGSREESKRAA